MSDAHGHKEPNPVYPFTAATLLIFGVAVGALGTVALILIAKVPEHFLNDWGNILGAIIGTIGAAGIAGYAVKWDHVRQRANLIDSLNAERSAAALRILNELDHCLLWCRRATGSAAPYHSETAELGYEPAQYLTKPELFDPSTVLAVLDVQRHIDWVRFYRAAVVETSQRVREQPEYINELHRRTIFASVLLLNYVLKTHPFQRNHLNSWNMAKTDYGAVSEHISFALRVLLSTGDGKPFLGHASELSPSLNDIQIMSLKSQIETFNYLREEEKRKRETMSGETKD